MGRDPYLIKATRRRCLAAFFAASLLVTCVGCGEKQDGREVAANVDGHNIYLTDVEKYYQSYYRSQASGADSLLLVEQATSMRLSILLRQLIDNEILMRRAEALTLLVTDEEVDGKLNEFKSPYTKEQFDAQLKDKGITLEDFKRELRRSITVDKVINKEITSKISVTNQDITNYYNAHKSEFNLIRISLRPHPRDHYAEFGSPQSQE